MTDQEIELLSTAIATKIAAVIDARISNPLPALLKPQPMAEQYKTELGVGQFGAELKEIRVKRGWPKGKKRGRRT